MQPTWSVIIPTLNEQTTILFLIRDLLAQTQPPGEIIVVDGGSTDQTVAVVQRFTKKYQQHWLERSLAVSRLGLQHTQPASKRPCIKITVIDSHSPVGAQRDVGGGQARFEYLAFFDADVRLPADFFAKVTTAMQARALTTACPAYVPFDSQKPQQTRFSLSEFQSPLVIRVVYWVFNLIFALGETRYPSGAGSCILTTRQDFEKVNGFQASSLCDDMEYIRGAAREGKFGMLSQAVFVSDRRWRHYGFWPTLQKYLQLSWHFLQDDFLTKQEFEYEFGKYESGEKELDQNRSKK